MSYEELYLKASKLKAANLKKAYQGRYAVKGISLEVAQGQVVGLLGPNGAGKTTTFYMIVGVQKPDEGTILLDGQDITRFPVHKRAKAGLGYLSQERSIFRKLTVEENLIAVLEMLPLSRDQRKERLDTLLNELGIQHVRKIKGYALSGGESRRAEIDRALSDHELIKIKLHSNRRSERATITEELVKSCFLVNLIIPSSSIIPKFTGPETSGTEFPPGISERSFA